MPELTNGTETLNRRSVCKVCGGETGIKGSSGRCQFCGAEWVAEQTDASTLPSDLLAEDLINLTEADKQDEDKRKLNRIAQHLLPDRALIENPIEYLSRLKVNTIGGNLEDPFQVSQLIDIAFEKQQEEFLTAIRDELNQTPPNRQYEYQMLVRLSKWVDTQKRTIEEYIETAKKNMVGEALVFQGNDWRDGPSYTREKQSPAEQIDNGYDPVELLDKLIHKNRQEQMGDTNRQVTTSGENFYLDMDSFNLRLLNTLLVKKSRLPSVHLTEMLRLIEDLSKNPKLPGEGFVTYSTEKNSISGRKKMSKTDRLLELLNDPQVYPTVAQILNEVREVEQAREVQEYEEKRNRPPDVKDSGGFFSRVRSLFTS
jgi:hypothetical protein